MKLKGSQIQLIHFAKLVLRICHLGSYVSFIMPHKEVLGHGPLGRFNRHHIVISGKGAIVVGHFDFEGDGLDIPYNTLLAAKA